MCGIFGLLSATPIDQDAFRSRVAELAHRGPDGEGMFLADGAPPCVALGHRRLAVIDLAGGEQPMVSADHAQVLVFNGEIYNFRQLRRRLETAGHTFRTHSDTEVLLNGYRQWGAGVLQHLEGMFAFAVYDVRARRLLLARDRMGQKPLFYYRDSGTLGFASELEPLLRLRGGGRFSTTRLAEYLTHGFVSGPHTCYHGVQRLLPGHQLCIDLDDPAAGRSEAYWELPEPGELRAAGRHDSPSPAELERELERLLRAAVRKRLVSDVPLGAFLSGGLDSSLVVAMMARDLGPSVRTFSIGFADPSYDESGHAARVAAHLGVRHTQEQVDLGEGGDLDRILRSFGEPFGDSSALPTRALSAVTRKHVTVAMSGDGADELLGGYQRYLGRNLAAWYLRLPAPLRRDLERVESRLREGVEYYGTSWRKKLRLFLNLARRVEQGVEGLPVFFSPAEIGKLFPAWGPLPPTYPQSRLGSGSVDVLAHMMTLDLLTYLPEDILVKVDRMSMACSLEVRSPFMDHRLVEFCQRLPANLKVRGLTTKHLLKRVALRYLPSDVVRRRKHGFSVPLGRWFRGKLGDRYLGVLAGVDAGLDRDYAAALLAEHRDGLHDHAHRLWYLYVLMHWIAIEGVAIGE